MRECVRAHVRVGMRASVCKDAMMPRHAAMHNLAGLRQCVRMCRRVIVCM